MTLVMVLLTMAVVAGVSAVVAGVVSGGLADPASPIPARALPAGPLTGQDVADLRFVQAFRGYRMDQVDAAMDSLAVEVERLRALLPEGASGPSFGGPGVAVVGAGVESSGEPSHSADPPLGSSATEDRSTEDRSTEDDQSITEDQSTGWPAGRD